MSAYNYKQISIELKKHINFNRSEQLALNNGFEVVLSESAYNGRFFVKNDKKWIHNIDALKRQLGIKSDIELEDLEYDVDAYYEIH